MTRFLKKSKTKSEIFRRYCHCPMVRLIMLSEKDFWEMRKGGMLMITCSVQKKSEPETNQ